MKNKIISIIILGVIILLFVITDTEMIAWNDYTGYGFIIIVKPVSKEVSAAFYGCLTHRRITAKLYNQYKTILSNWGEILISFSTV